MSSVYYDSEGNRCVSAHVAAARDYVRVYKLVAAGLSYKDIEQQTGIPAATAQRWVPVKPSVAGAD
jgi:uncharacterized protein YerC